MEALYVVFFAFACASFSLLVDFCLGDLSGDFKYGRIFSGIGFWLLDKYDGWEARQNEKAKIKMIERSDINVARSFVPNPWKVFVCPICFNVWIGLTSGVLLYFFGFFHWGFIIPYVAISNYILRLSMRVL